MSNLVGPCGPALGAATGACSPGLVWEEQAERKGADQICAIVRKAGEAQNLPDDRPLGSEESRRNVMFHPIASVRFALFLSTAAMPPLLLISTPAAAQSTCTLEGGGDGGATAANSFDFACGPSASASSINANLPALAVGTNALANGDGSQAIGIASSALGHDASALGFEAGATGEKSTAAGTASKAGSSFSLSANHVVPGAFENDRATALGANAEAGAGADGQDNATAVGVFSQANAFNATSVGMVRMPTARSAPHWVPRQPQTGCWRRRSEQIRARISATAQQSALSRESMRTPRRQSEWERTSPPH